MPRTKKLYYIKERYKIKRVGVEWQWTLKDASHLKNAFHKYENIADTKI